MPKVTDYTDGTEVVFHRYPDNWTDIDPVDRIDLRVHGTNGTAYLKVEDLSKILADVGLLVIDAKAALPTVVPTSATTARVYEDGQDPQAYGSRYDTYGLRTEDEYTKQIATLVALREYVRSLPDPDVETATKALIEVGMDDTDGPVPAEVARRLKAAGYKVVKDV